MPQHNMSQNHDNVSEYHCMQVQSHNIFWAPKMFLEYMKIPQAVFARHRTLANLFLARRMIAAVPDFKHILSFKILNVNQEKLKWILMAERRDS